MNAHVNSPSTMHATTFAGGHREAKGTAHHARTPRRFHHLARRLTRPGMAGRVSGGSKGLSTSRGWVSNRRSRTCVTSPGAEPDDQLQTAFPLRSTPNNTGSMAESPEYDLSTYQRSADVYDVMNAARGKSYADEAATLLRLIRQRVADAGSLLDVACGTGLHLSHLRRDLRVEGIEPHPRFRAIARDRLDGVPVHDGDMRTFDLGRSFDVVTCLFSAIGYMLTLDDLRAAIGQMAAHVSPGGLLVVEPWFHPEGWIDGLVMAESATTEDLAIARLSHSGATARSRISTSTGRLDAGRPFTDGARRTRRIVSAAVVARWTTGSNPTASGCGPMTSIEMPSHEPASTSSTIARA